MPFCDTEGWIVFSERRDMDFSLCFQDSVLTLIPSVVLLIGLAPRLHKVIGKGRLKDAQANIAFYIKMLAVTAAFAIQLALLIKIVSEDGFRSSSLLSTVFYLAAVVGAAVLHWFEYFNINNPFAGLLVFWLLTALISIFPTRSSIQESHNGLASPFPLLKLLFTIVSFLIFALENVPKPHYKTLIHPGSALVVEQTNPSPEPRANFFTRITFFWLLPLLKLGKKRSLRMDDIWSLHPKFLSYPLYLTTKAKLDADEAQVLERIKTQEKDKAMLSKGTEKNKKDLKTQKGRINLLGTVLHTVGHSFFIAAIPRLFYIAALYVRPILFSNLIEFVTGYSEASRLNGGVPQEPWIGFGLMIAVFVSGVLTTLFDAQFMNICFNGGLKARSVFVTLIYRKALRLSSTNKQEGMGSIVNHMSTDVDKVVAFFRVIHYFWSSIIEIIIAVTLLYAEVRYAMFASVAVVVMILAMSAACSPKIAHHQKVMMKFSDIRMKLITELVTYIKSIKFYAWERYFSEKVMKARMDQLNQLRWFRCWITFIAVILNSIGPLSIFATMTVYSAVLATEAEPLDTRRIFVAITLITMMEGPVSLMNESMSSIVGGKVAYDRLRDFLNSEEVDDNNVERNLDPEASEYAYEITNGRFGWYTPEAIQSMIQKKEKEDMAKAKEDAKTAKKQKKNNDNKDQNNSDNSTFDEKSEKSTSFTPENSRDSMGPVLHDINLWIKRGSITAIVGRVGEGKSSIVGALLGEMHKYSGTVRSYGSLAYVAQSAWILNDTVRNNILFGRPYDKDRYLNTIRACALTPDFKMLVNGDKTIIGEKGINLSGGQKQRISIARAVYADADIYILDDPLSAVDAHVDQHIFEHALTNILAKKTRILVTNGVSHLPNVDQIMVIKQGRISQDGLYSDLIQDEQGDLFRLIQESKVTTMIEKDDTDLDDSVTEDSNDGSAFTPEDEDDDVAKVQIKGPLQDTDFIRPVGPVKRPTFKRAKSSKVKENDLKIEDDTDEIDEEVIAEGSVSWNVYKFYIKTLGIGGLVIFFTIVLGFFAMELNTQLWLKRWGNENVVAVATNSEPEHTSQYWTLTYFAWVMSSTLMLGITVGISMIVMARKASKKLHTSMLGPLVRSPMSFFDVTSSGKIVNRFSHDINAIDIELPLQFLNYVFIILSVASIFTFCIASSPYFALIILPVGYAYYWLGGFFLVSSREIKRLDSAARSPMYAHFGETLGGLVTIRAFHDSDRFAIMLETISILVSTLVALLAILQRNSVDSGIFSIVLSQIGSLTMVMSHFLSTTCLIETSVVSVERVREYSELTPEARDVIPDSRTDESWPQHGGIIFKGYSTRYREGLDLVLKNLDVTIRGGERIGVVGRTGAGKSSITMALFRMVEPAEGSISIDGIDISTLGLHELRSRLTIIPQDPFLFGDSVRSNLDPYNKHTDSEIWNALESASLKSYIASLPEGLSTTIENGGENMSLGQRQLMSLARAMLAKGTRILCLDEATAAIDIETDNAIQRALRREFKDCTVLTIAHRINTIMDSDRILVLDNGRVSEFDPPQTLLQNKNGIFYSLAIQSGNA
ncbi:hypothetical protein BG011_001527 [Mortierella polycephala]|uniref:P-loop containing nucleoside triphosphate hydrolase protein n=1 Tax=Mortierella polycephala TaxID=41804 RepID=A0A9P6U684_9FUNG|nr:hypothetical protein BG011_001527 [Mortierella polycephala]